MFIVLQKKIRRKKDKKKIILETQHVAKINKIIINIMICWKHLLTKKKKILRQNYFE